MTKEEAKEILTHNWTRVDNPNYSESELDEAFFLAIEALQQEPMAGGEWKTVIRHEHYPSGREYEADYCSVCGRRGSLEYLYCPFCGARMKGGAE